MSKVVAFLYLTLDGVMQATGRADEDRRGGFEDGGWAAAHYVDPVLLGIAEEGMARTRALLFGRRTYEDFSAFWPNQPEPNPFTEVLNRTRKYVAATTLSEPLPWVNSTLLKGDAADAIAELREEPGGDLVILGSGELVRSLMRRDLIDEYVLLIYPLVLGKGRRLFEEGTARQELRLVDSRTSTTGVLIGTYQPVRDATPS